MDDLAFKHKILYRRKDHWKVIGLVHDLGRCVPSKNLEEWFFLFIEERGLLQYELRIFMEKSFDSSQEHINNLFSNQYFENSERWITDMSRLNLSQVAHIPEYKNVEHVGRISPFRMLRGNMEITFNRRNAEFMFPESTTILLRSKDQENLNSQKDTVNVH